MNPTQLFDPASHSYTYILFDEATREALILDPVAEQLQRDLDTVARLNLKLKWAVETHAHADHITSAAKLAEMTGARLAAPAGCGVATAAVQLGDGDVLSFGRESLRVLHTPGHTAGSVCFYWERKSVEEEEIPTELTALPLGHEMRPDLRQDERHVFTGDTLLIGGCGRTDFQSGSAGQLYDSITQVLIALPEDTIVWPGHDYNERTQSTIGLEKATNPRIAGKSRADFVALMAQLDLPKPQRIDEAVPANQRSGLGAPAPAGAQDDGPTPADGYAGDISPQAAYRWMTGGQAVLVDVRTDAEREWVGFVPGARVAAWKQWPGMALNPDFDAQLREAAAEGQPVMLLCRSGVRSVPAAQRATELGLTAYNIVGGFEGAPDANAQRGHQNGWRHAGLPWRQN